MMPENRPSRTTLVQVVSSPYSGSTILGVLLGAAPAVYYGGEMDRVPNPVWGSGQLCSCGAMTSDCPFWRAARERFETAHEVAELERGQRRFEPWRALPRTVSASLLGGETLRRHARETAAFVRAVAETAGVPVVVDTSKFAGRALTYAAARGEGLDVRFVHVIRDGRAVLASRKARGSEQGTRTESIDFASGVARRWVVANLAFAALGRRWPSAYLRLRHEDFLADPEATLRRLEAFLGVSLAVPIGRLRADPTFPVTHVPTGNRFRLQGEVRLRNRTESRPLPSAQARAFWRVAGPLAALYGYRRAPRALGEPPRADAPTP